MTPLDLYRKAKNLGLTVEADGADLLVSPGSKCPADFVRLLKEHKPALLAWLASPPCSGRKAVPPVYLPMSALRPDPLPAHARRVVEYITRQIGDKAGLLCEWLLRRENAYAERFHWPVEACVYASARDCACWQTRRDEAALCELLEGFDEVAKQTR